MRRIIKRTLSVSSEILERLRHRKYISKPNGNTDLDWHIEQAAGWLLRAQDAGHDRGVAYGAELGGGFLASYPETTGYIIPTFLDLADYFQDPDYLNRAIEMGIWEASIQMPCGAVMAGRVNSGTPQPAVFNTGQVLLGWAALLRVERQDLFLSAGIRAADWLIASQEADGNWIRGNSPYAKQGATLYNVKAAWGLAEFGQCTHGANYIFAAARNAEYAMKFQRSNGWFENCCLTDSQRPLLHTIAYTMQGLLGIGMLLERQDMIDAVERTAASLLQLMDDQGFIPGRIDGEFKGCVKWCCLTGSAQTSIVWSELYRISGNRQYQEAAERVNRFLMGCHNTCSDDPAIRGGVMGSWPIWGDYGKYMVLNWATKFFIDALLLQKRLQSSAAGGAPRPRSKATTPSQADFAGQFSIQSGS